MKKILRGVLALAVALAALATLIAQPVFLGSSDTYRSQADPERLKKSVKDLVSAYGERDFAHRANLEKIADALREQLLTATPRVTEQAFKVDEGVFKNIFAEFGPETGPMVIVGAHYDTAGPFPGADDNASGIAGLLELARLFQKTPPTQRVMLACYVLEEPPYFRTSQMGSARHVRQLLKQSAEVKLMISVEMIGYFSDTPGSQHYPLPGLNLIYPSAGNFAGVVSTPSNVSITRKVKKAMLLATPLPIYSINAPREVPGIDFSDHLAFLEAGYPAVMVTDTADNRNLAYHTADDVPERLDYQRMAMVVDGLYAVTKEPLK